MSSVLVRFVQVTQGAASWVVLVRPAEVGGEWHQEWHQAPGLAPPRAASIAAAACSPMLGSTCW